MFHPDRRSRNVFGSLDNRPSDRAALQHDVHIGVYVRSQQRIDGLCSDDLKGHATAGGIAFLGSAGMLGSFAGPTVMGWSKAATGSFQAGLFAIASITLLGAALIVSNRWLIQKTV